MSEHRVVQTDRAPAAIGPYSQAVVVDDRVWTSGQIGMDPSTGELVGEGIAEQTEQMITNLAAVLGASGSSLARVLKTTVYLADMGDFAAMNAVYAQRFGDARPARSTVAAAGLPKGARVEIDAVAVVG